MKKTWKGINELIRQNSKLSSVNQIMHNNMLINEPKQIAGTFNNFANVGPEVDKSIPKTPISPLSFLSDKVARNFLFKTTCNSEVMTIILTLNEKSSIKFLKIAATIVVPQLVEVIDLFF